MQMILLRHVAIQKALGSFPCDEVSSFSAKGSGSGSAFFLLTINAKPHIAKCAFPDMPPLVHQRLNEEIETYIALMQLRENGFSMPYVRPLVLTKEPFAMIVLPFVSGISTAMLVRDPRAGEIYPSIFMQGIGRLLTYYRTHQKPCLDPVAWFQQNTIEKALQPLRDKQALFPDVLPTLCINGVSIENGLVFFQKLGSEGCATSDPVVKMMRQILFPRFYAEMTTDPNALNEIINPETGELCCIDPGRLEKAQFVYPLIKHEGSFAHALPFVLNNELTIQIEAKSHEEEPTPENWIVSCKDEHREGYARSKALHTLPAVMSRLESHSDGKQLLASRPFFVVHCFFFAFRQFLRDLGYAVGGDNLLRQRADMAFFSLGMAVIKPVLENIAVEIIREEKNLADPENSVFLKELTNRVVSARLSDTADPAVRLFHEWFGDSK